MSLALLGLCVTGCKKNNQNQQASVISERYIHKYGYDVSKDEWAGATYPGQVITTLRNGVTITSSYEDGILNGPTTYTFPHSNTIESIHYFEHGHLIKKISYSIRGVPAKEIIYLGVDHVKTTMWYPNGTPMSVEEYIGNQLIEAEYYNTYNETEYRVKSGKGERVSKNELGKVIMKELIDGGAVVVKETYHPNGSPESIIPYHNGMVHGHKKLFAVTGEPLYIETWSLNSMDGLATYFQNGCKYLEVVYRNGRKDGVERHYIDGEHLVEETNWASGKKHGPSTIYHDGMSKTEWYYNDENVSQARFDELCERERSISTMNERSRPSY